MSLSVYAWISISVFTPILVIFLAYLGFVNHWCSGKETDADQPTPTQEAAVATVNVANADQYEEGGVLTEAVRRRPL